MSECENFFLNFIIKAQIFTVDCKKSIEVSFGYESRDLTIPFLNVDSKASRLVMKNIDIENMAKNKTKMPTA